MHAAVEGAGGVLDWYLVEGDCLPCGEAVFCGRGGDRGVQEYDLIGGKGL